MGKGRAPCCDKTQVKRGPWSPEEDLNLIAFIQKHGHENWRSLPKQAGLQRCGKSCRLRWINYLRPDVKRGNFTPEEQETIIRLHKSLGNKWSKIASLLPGRTDNEIKNVWNTHLKKRLDPKNSESSGDESKLQSSVTSSASSSSESFFSNERSNQANIPLVNEFIEQASEVTMTDKIEPASEKNVSIKVNGINEDLKESSNSLPSLESSILNSSLDNITYKPEQQLASPLLYPGPYDVDNTLQEVDKPNHDLVEIPWESDYDIWSLLDSIEPFESFQSNEVQLGASQNHDLGVESVQVSEAMKGSHEFEGKAGVVGETNESNKDQFLPKNSAVEQQIDPPQTFHFNEMIMPAESELDFDFNQLWPSSPQIPSF